MPREIDTPSGESEGLYALEFNQTDGAFSRPTELGRAALRALEELAAEMPDDEVAKSALETLRSHAMFQREALEETPADIEGLDDARRARAYRFLGTWLNERREDLQIPGLSIVVCYDGILDYAGTFGVANGSTGEELTEEHCFAVASQTKPFTAAALMKLAEANQLELDLPISRYLSWLNDHTDEAFRTITVRQIMGHQAGISRDGDDLDYFSDAPSKGQFKTSIMNHALRIEPGSSMKYSNMGYALLGLLVEEVAGQPYEEYVNTEIIEHLGLYSTTFYSHQATLLATPHDKKSQYIEEIADVNAFRPAMGLFSTPMDMTTFFDALRPGSGLLLSDESKKELQSVQGLVEDVALANGGYGLGVELDNDDGKRSFQHAGGFMGYVSRTIAREDGLTVSVAFNKMGVRAHEVTQGVIAAIDFFQQHEPDGRDIVLDGHFRDAFLVAAGGKRWFIDLNAANPFKDAIELKEAKEGVFIANDSNPYGFKGEQLYESGDEVQLAGERFMIRNLLLEDDV